jgi:hypothetical protein
MITGSGLLLVDRSTRIYIENKSQVG